ncbi:hypothetical protein M9458_047941, partial [Cirrhinus mrigala]
TCSRRDTESECSQRQTRSGRVSPGSHYVCGLISLPEVFHERAGHEDFSQKQKLRSLQRLCAPAQVGDPPSAPQAHRRSD